MENSGLGLRCYNSNQMKEYRLNRLFNAKSGRCFDVAIDHGFFNQYGFLGSIENAASAISPVVDAKPDAVQ